MAQPGQFQVGQLYRDGYINGLKVYSQPGGIGTPVFPQAPRIFPQQNMGYPQTPMSYPSLYVSGCSHFLNCWEIYSYYDMYAEEVMALVLCPQCGWIQQILPLADYENYLIVPIVTA